VNVLIVGGGGREHALAWRLKQDDPALTLLAAPGNPGIAELASCHAVAATDIEGLVALARQEKIHLTVVGPEAPLAAGIVDRFRSEALPIFGPTRAAAQIETSKAFAKQLMMDAGIPTARAITCTEPERARGAARELGAPVVIKASGLAAGKGVFVCHSIEEAERAIDTILVERVFGVAGSEVLVEEFMEGEELSLFAITNGDELVTLEPVQDHKRLLDGDRGPNTGGMGAYSPVPGLSADLESEVVDRILRPALSALRSRGTPFTGLLYAGLMLTSDGPKVVEFNCRFGDPETQAILPVANLRPTLLDLLLAVARETAMPENVSRQIAGYGVTTVLASAGYPDAPRTGDPIDIPEVPENVHVFHAGTKRLADGTLVTSGGRVLAITGVGPSLEDAQQTSRDFASRVEFTGKQFRSDIGWRALARRSGAGHAGAS